MSSSKSLVHLFVVAISVLLTLGQAHAAPFVTAPSTEHKGWNTFPFGEKDFRYQQIYDASLFPGPIDIVSLAFSPRYGLVIVDADLEIRLTRTTVAVEALKSDLDKNITGSLTTVFDDPSFSQDLRGKGGQDAFSLVFNFSSNPFSYDPFSGENLLLDIVVRSMNESPRVGPSVSLTDGKGLSARAYDGGDPEHTETDGNALRTRIGYVSGAPVPEPCTVLMVGSGLFALGLFKRKFKE